ncbi:MAG: redoxin domain-containing protein [Bacteroidetes bacterium]|nr:MAG: redoxin domain-containing protein [Bacteroidota bacterium]
MTKKFLFLLIIPILFSFTTIRLPGIHSITLQTISNERFPLSKLTQNKWSVIVFLLPDCPACESYSSTINKLRTKYKNSSIEFYGVFPGTFNSLDEMNAFKKTYKIDFPLLTDPENVLVRSLDAKIVPSAFLLNIKGETLYKGRINDWMYALGKKRAVITKNDLDDALQAVTTGKPIQVKETKAIGCILE